MKLQNCALPSPPSASISILEPAIASEPSAMVIDENGSIARSEPSGHDSMNGAASVKTARGPSALSKALGIGSLLPATRINVWWRASIVAILAAVLKIPLSLMRGAAPRYLSQLASTFDSSRRDGIHTQKHQQLPECWQCWSCSSHQ